MVDDEMLESIYSLNSKHRDVFNIVHNWAKESAKHKGVNFYPIHISFQEEKGQVNPTW